MTKPNQFCPICGRPTNGKVYDRPSCKQKAYRDRKKKKKEAERLTIDLESYLIQDKAIKCFGDPMNDALGSFFVRHGKESYIEMLTIIDKILSA